MPLPSPPLALHFISLWYCTSSYCNYLQLSWPGITFQTQNNHQNGFILHSQSVSLSTGPADTHTHPPHTSEREIRGVDSQTVVLSGSKIRLKRKTTIEIALFCILSPSVSQWELQTHTHTRRRPIFQHWPSFPYTFAWGPISCKICLWRGFNAGGPWWAVIGPLTVGELSGPMGGRHVRGGSHWRWA